MNGKSWSGHERNHSFINQGGGRFVDVSRLSGTDMDGDGRSVAIVDWDDDGSLDMILRSRSAPRVQVFHNRYGKPGNFISFELEGNASSCNRDAIGAKVEIVVDGKRILRGLRAGEGFLAQSSKRLHFGLGKSTKVDKVSVRWPDGSESKFENLLAGKRYQVTQANGSEGLSEIPARSVDFDSLPSALPAAHNFASRAVMAFPLPLAEMSVPAFLNPDRKVRDLAGAPLLLNLWQVTCRGCIEEFGAFHEHREKIAATGLRIVTLNADADPEAPVSIEEVYRMLDGRGLRNEDAGFVGDLLPHMMHTIQRHIYGELAVSGEVTMPTSWLLDDKGQLLVIYRGPVNMDQLYSDLEALKSGPEHLTLDRLSNGLRLANPKRKLFELAQAFQAKAKASVGSKAKAFLAMADYYFAEDKLQRGFFTLDGELKSIRDPRYDPARKTDEQ